MASSSTTASFRPRHAQAKDPRFPDRHKKLTYQEDGGTNNTCIKLDGTNSSRSTAGEMEDPAVAAEPGPPQLLQVRLEYLPERVEVTQEVELVRGDLTRLLDTCSSAQRSRTVTVTHKIGLRVMLERTRSQRRGALLPSQGIGSASIR